MSLRFPIMVRKVQGHSMVPVLPPGTVVYAWRWYRSIKPGSVIIFDRNNRETIKRVDATEPKGLYVLGDHPETSTDSRHYGAIPRSWVRGVVIWPKVPKIVSALPKKSLKKPIRRIDM